MLHRRTTRSVLESLPRIDSPETRMDSERQLEQDYPVGPAEEGPSAGGIGQTVIDRLDRCAERLEGPELNPGWVVHEVRKDLMRELKARALRLGVGRYPEGAS